MHTTNRLSLGAVVLFALTANGAIAQLPQSLPEVTAYAGDPRLEPIPSSPIHVPNVTVFGEGRQLRLRFPPRVNGQNHSDGDGHADLFAFFDAATGLPIAGQLPVVEAVIRALHEHVCASQPTYRAWTEQGWQDHERIRGEYKLLPNNPQTKDGQEHAYVPVEWVKDEMERLVTEQELALLSSR